LQHQSNRIAETFPSKRVDRVDNRKKKKKKKIIKHWASQTIGFSDEHGVIHCGAFHHNFVNPTEESESNVPNKIQLPKTLTTTHQASFTYGWNTTTTTLGEKITNPKTKANSGRYY
jgi:hypothetical protein